MKPKNPPDLPFGDDEEEDWEPPINAEGAFEDEWREKPGQLGDLLKKARRAKGLNQQQMAKIVGISLRSYKAYEIQETLHVPATVLQRLVEFLDVDPGLVLMGSPSKVNYDVVVDDVLDMAMHINKTYQRVDGAKFGLKEGLTGTELRDVVKAVLRERDLQRVYRGDPSFQLGWEEIEEAVKRNSAFYEGAANE
ncbi:helix-turn-helix domain-containing protein [Thioclava sp. GXIMD4215]|uniref:helix-turn-helix domain-containing protein n=1 Tax=Thioclava sp. GXIMD4215 TaxID=3131928 RepID=UPI0032522926